MLFIAETNITTDPFSIKFEAPLKAIGTLLVFAGCTLMIIHIENVGYKKGLKRGSEESIKEFVKYVNQENEKNNLPK